MFFVKYFGVIDMLVKYCVFIVKRKYFYCVNEIIVEIKIMY